MDKMYICPVCEGDLDKEALRRAALGALLEENKTQGVVDVFYRCDACEAELVFGCVQVNIDLEGDQAEKEESND